MTAIIDRSALESLRSVVAQRFGLRCEESDLDHLASIFRQRMREAHSADASSYALRLASDRTELRALAPLLTVGETSFMRNADNFRVLGELALPERARVRGAERRLRILSAGCASGEETYSLAVIVGEHPELRGWDVRITGIDVNPAAIELARRARYSDWSLRDTPAALREKYFRPAGRDHLLVDEVKQLVAFEERNLVDEDPVFWRPESFDVVFCRNVLMYFTPDAMQAIVARIVRSLAPGGFLFLGYAENLRGIVKDLHLRHSNETFFYQRRTAEEQAAHEREASAEPWYDAVGRSSARVASLTQPPPESQPRLDIATGLQLLQRERQGEVKEVVKVLPPETNGDPDAQLLRAVLLTNAGRFHDAEEVCRRLLERDELNAGAHYLMALARDHEGDLSGAVEHDETAIYLDPTFAMPRLHLGLVAKRRRDLPTTRRAIGEALQLLAREDASRIVLFGGGFTREALLEFCGAELRACGGER